MMPANADCPLCDGHGETVLYRNAFLRVINAQDPDYPAFTRVILNRHVQEMTDLNQAERHGLMSAVYLVEALQRRHFQPAKINLAQFGNMVPHLHWHIIPRFANDRHFPNPVWGMPREEVRVPDSDAARDCANRVAHVVQQLPAYHHAIGETFLPLFGETDGTLPDQADVEQTLLKIADL